MLPNFFMGIVGFFFLFIYLFRSLFVPKRKLVKIALGIAVILLDMFRFSTSRPRVHFTSVISIYTFLMSSPLNAQIRHFCCSYNFMIAAW